jgi:hypothetical protein
MSNFGSIPVMNFMAEWEIAFSAPFEFENVTAATKF